MQKQTETKSDNTSPLKALHIARQVSAIKRAVLHNVEHGVVDMPAKGLLPSLFTASLQKETLDRLNKKLVDYDVQVDAYKIKTRGKSIDRIAVTHIDSRLVKPSPAYKAALQARMLVA